MDYEAFTKATHSLLVAPAGHGKTHTISECLKYTSGKQLILTHTHAGIASIKEKLQKAKVSTSSYHVETITSFAQKYVLGFHTGSEIPPQENTKLYYPFIITRAKELLSRNSIYNIFKNTYTGLFVDEYQDCTIPQHELIIVLAKQMSTRILGDSLQGIFDFHHSKLVDMNDRAILGEFSESTFSLQRPYRWIKGNNEKLGEDLSFIRAKLLASEPIDLASYPSIEYLISSAKDLYDPKSFYHKTIRTLLKEENLLILHPNTTNIDARIKVIQRFSVPIFLLESIDDEIFYTLAKKFNCINIENQMGVIIETVLALFNKTAVNNWFNEWGFKNKTSKKDKDLLSPIQQKLKESSTNPSFKLYSEILQSIKELPDMKVFRKEVFRSICRALEFADSEQISVLEAMKRQRNNIRRMGRKVFGRCIGTTLLTKGLEFDTVVVLNAHQFNSPKHLYVALTRASKRLIVISESLVLSPF